MRPLLKSAGGRGLHLTGAVSDFALAAALPAFERAGVDLSECGAPGVLRYTGRGSARGRPETTTECRDLLPHIAFRHRLVECGGHQLLPLPLSAACRCCGHDSWLMMDQVGTGAGSEKDTEGWVVTKAELPVSGSESTGGSSSFTVPAWAPGSSDVLARWSARLTIERGGRDIDTRGDFTVVVGRDNVRQGRRRTAAAHGRRRRDQH